MKKLFLLFAAAMSLLAFNSCQDSDDDLDAPEVPEVPAEPEAEGPNYLVMFYGTGGGNLDGLILSNIMQAIDEGCDENVKMTFQFKPSEPWQEHPLCANFNGTRRFTYDDNAEFTGTLKEKTSSYPALDDPSAEYYLANFKSEKIGDETYDISSPEALTEFIKWSKEKYPNAKRTLLILSSHGGGWDVHNDGRAQTRAMLPDDNLDEKMLSDIDMMNGINNAGGVDVIYTDACLMNMYENLYTYSKAAKYLLSAVEVTPGDGGDYGKLLRLLKSAKTDDASMESAFCQYVDHCTSAQWWGKRISSYSDLGFYNLTKLGNITPVLKKVADTLAEKFTSDESIQPSVNELPLSDTFAPYIRVAVAYCEMVQEHLVFDLDDMPDGLRPYMIEDGLFGDPEDLTDTEYATCDAAQLVYWLRVGPTEGAQEAFKKYPDEREGLEFVIKMNMTCSYSITDMLRILDNSLDEVGAKNNPFKQLRAELLDAIKSVGHIACTTPNPIPGVDEAYELCSTGLVIMPLNSISYTNEYNQAYYYITDYAEALRYYQATEFDRQVGWSKFLKVLDVQPSPFTNKTRKELETNKNPYDIWS